MATAHAKVFKSNRSQAGRLPKDAALPEDITNVDIVSIENKRIITPASSSWDDWFDGPQVSDDFMLQRDQPADQEPELF
jgi:antitoxin VapB